MRTLYVLYYITIRLFRDNHFPDACLLVTTHLYEVDAGVQAFGRKQDAVIYAVFYALTDGLDFSSCNVEYAEVHLSGLCYIIRQCSMAGERIGIVLAKR